MNPLVPHERRAVPEKLPAFPALVGLFYSVNSPVSDESVVVLKELPT